MPVLQHMRSRSSSGMADAANAEAFARLYAEFVDPIYGYCLSRLGDASAAEDATGTVFAHALAAGPRYGDPTIRSWLFAIAHNVIANRIRDRRLESPLDDAVAVADSQPPLDDVVISNDERDRLRRALRHLPEDQRHVVELRIAGLTGPEIARSLDRSHGAVKMLQLRAYARLRDLLANANENQEVGARHG